MIIVLIPAKRLEHAKSRLKPDLPPDGRARLVRDTLRRNVQTLRSTGLFERIVIITRDEQIAAWARGWRAEVLSEDRDGLNEALTYARDRLCGQADAMLIVHGDVAWLAAEDVRDMVGLAAEPACIVLAPDRHERGTNALFIKPPGAIELSFGTDSAAKHLAAAKALGLPAHLYRSSSTSLDVDDAADLAIYDIAPFLIEPDS